MACFSPRIWIDEANQFCRSKLGNDTARNYKEHAINREETRKAAEVMLHYANGGEVLVRSRHDCCKFSTTDPAWSWDSCLYYVKPREIKFRQWAVVNTGCNRVEAVHQYREAAEQFMLGMAHHKFLAIVELKGTYTCDTQ